jgi:tRNA (guanine-N7-)-methyltransferase
MDRPGAAGDSVRHPGHGGPEEWRGGKRFPFEFLSRQPLRAFPEVSGPLTVHTLEIGPGRGEYLLGQAAVHPERQFAAIEVSGERCTKLIRRIEQAGLKNVVLANGDARAVMPRLIREASLQLVVVLFPDPWPKRRHVFHRLMTTEFLADLARYVAPGGELFLKSDAPSYVEWVAANASSIPAWTVALPPAVQPIPAPDEPCTFYERKQRAAGRSILTLRLRRSNS